MTIFNKTRPKPELLIFARMFVVGILGAEVFQVTYHIAKAFASILIDVGLWPKLVPAALISAFCILYAVNRGIVTDFKKHIKRIRFDLFAYIGLGIWANFFGAQFLDEFHQNLTKCDPWLAPFLMIALLIPLFSNWFLHGSTTKNTLAQFSFLSDEEIKTSGEDLLEHKDLAKNFAEVVLQSSSDSRLVFGIDGPWGSGKTTFINFAEEHWKKEQDVVVCRFEPLRYASDSESDLSQRLIREITDTIQEHFFVPELHSIASRYSRLLKGDPTITYHGLKLSLEQRGETLDELLESINSVLDAYGIRLIIVIDDLDRLDPKAVNNVLFVTRRAFNLKRTTYILCYDTEILISGKEDGQRAREFLEKFVTVKQNLFVDPKQLIQFLRHDWSEGVPGEIPADLLHKASPFLNELADALSEGEGAEYLGLIGDMRKIKRFVNAFTLLQLEKTDFARTDFHKRDLVNLILIHLHYPSLFRDIYTKETNEQSGTYSLSRKFGDRTFKNSEEFDDSAKTHPKSAEFLLRQLFDEKKIRRRTGDNFDELELRTRACFNHEPHRNLESYLLLIGKIIRPEPRKTFILYKNAVQRILEKETSIKTELESHDLALSHGTHAHSEFWRLLAN
ncbi:MAG TPA: P-loop NTPase fold protein, partial [Marinagarivorans sp.]|nr:P-loop NTPase fold protein [Marinagarivorans sp.]